MGSVSFSICFILHQMEVETFSSYLDNKGNPRSSNMSVCPCRSHDQNQLDYAKCCQPYVEGKKKATTAEELMRSRYSAYVVKNIDYIDVTQIDVPGEKFDKDEAAKWADSSEGKGLEIKKTQKGQGGDNTGTVEFVAHYKDKASGTELRHHETS